MTLKASTSTKRNVATITALVLPVLVALGAKGLGLRTAPIDGDSTTLENMASTTNPALAANTPKTVFSIKCQAAASHADRLRSEPLATNPFHYRFRSEASRSKPEDQTPRIDPNDSIDSLLLTGVMSGREPIAVVNGEIVRVGDEILNGWKVREIDPQTRIVKLVHESGRTRTLTSTP